MKFLALTIAALLLTVSFTDHAFAYRKTRGYTKKNGTYVQPYYSSSPNSSKSDNWSSSGNSNPFTGKKGYRSW